MKKKVIWMMIGLILTAGWLTGCVKTPEDSLVRQKGAASMKNYEEGTALEKKETEENTLRAVLNAPERYQSERKDETGKLTILTDAEVVIPDADQVSAIRVTQHPLDQATIDRVTKAFFPDWKIYSGDSYYQLTKSEIQAKIEILEGYVAEGNLDPYGYGTDETGKEMFDIYENIEYWKSMYQEAPEEKNLEEVVPQFGLPEDDGKGGTIIQEDYFDGVALEEDGTAFGYRIQKYNGMPMEFKISRFRGQENGNYEYSHWNDYEGYQASVPEGKKLETIQKEVGISYEDALKIAQEKVDRLEIPDMELYDWEYGLWWSGEEGYEAAKEKAIGYQFYFTRKLNGIPITGTAEYGGGLEEMDSEMETWGYERLEIIVSKEGIEYAEFLNQYDLGEVRTEHVNLLPFEDIMEIYEKMMLIQNADVLNHENFRTYHIDRITFGYGRIYEPSSSSKEGLLVPVWDFFGSFDTSSTYEGTTYEITNDMKTQSYLTINAVDGSIINRALGY
jgi:hypothetical protein